MSRYRKTMAEALQEVSDKNKLKVLARKIQRFKDKAFKKTMSTIKSPLFADNELDEGRMKDIFTADQEGKSAEEIAKLMKLPLKTVKSILGEETELDEFTLSQLNTLKKSYADMKGKTISPEKANALSKALDRLDLLSLRQLNKEKIPFVSTLARNKIYRKTGKFEEVELELEESVAAVLRPKAVMIAKKMAGNMTDAVKAIEKLMKGLSKDPVVATTLKRVNEDYLNEEEEQDLDKIALAKEKDTDALEKQLTAAQGQIAVLKQKIENEKNKAIKPMPNPDTGEIPLTIGLAHKLLNDKEKKEKEERNQKEISKQIKAASKGGAAPAPVAAETKLEAFTRKYLSYLNESEASDKAKAMGLDYMSFGRYGKGGKVTHKSVGGSLQALSKKDQEKEKEPKAKVAKPKTKTTGAIKNPDGSSTTSGQIKKEILKKIDDEDITSSDASVMSEFEDEFIALADDLRGTGDKETAEKIIDALNAVGEDDMDTAAKVDDMMNALRGKPDVNSAKQKELSSMTSLYTDATYSSKSLKDFVSDTSSIINKMGELADAGSMESDAYGPGIRSDAMVEIGASASEIQDKLEDMDIDDDIKIDINAALSTIADIDTDEYTEEGPTYLAIQDLKRLFGKLGGNKEKSKASSRATASSGVKKDLRKALKSAPKPGPDYDPRDYNKIKNIAKKAGDKETVDIIDAMNKAHDDNDYSEVSYQYVELRKRIEESYLHTINNILNEARFEVEGRVDYKGVSGGDDFSIVVDASNEKAAEDKVSDMLFKHRDQKKIGPRGGRGVDDYEIESVTRTSKSVTNKFSTYHAAEYKEAKVDELTKAQEKLPPALQKAIKDKETKKEDLGKEDDSVVKKVVGQLKKAVKAHDGQAKDLEKALKNEADQHGDEINDKKHDAMKKGEKETKKIADSGSKLTKVETEPKVDYKN